MSDLVLLPGMLGDCTAWDDVVARLSEPVSVSVSIHPGRLESADTVPDLAALVLAQAPASFVLAGHSFGAIVALEMQRRAPGRVRALALVNASARGPDAAQISAWQQWRRRTEQGEFAAVVKELALATLPAQRRHDAALVARNAAMGRAIGPAAFLRQLAAQQSRPDSLAALAAIRVPTLVVSGELDQVCPPARQQEILERLPGARAALLPGTGHMSLLESPGPVAGVLGPWLSTV